MDAVALACAEPLPFLMTQPMDVKLVVAKSLLLRRSVGLVGSGSLVFLD
jgi:hypothetical protein